MFVLDKTALIYVLNNSTLPIMFDPYTMFINIVVEINTKKCRQRFHFLRHGLKSTFIFNLITN